MNIPTLPNPPALTREAVMQTVQESQEHAAGLSVLVNMSYQSLSGNYKDRDILIRRVIHNKGDYYLDSFALDIKAPRLIKITQISSIRDTATGRLYENPYDFIRDRFGMEMTSNETTEPIEPTMTDFARVIQETGPEMTVLMYLVAIDGKRQAAERNLVLKYIQDRTRHLTYEEDDLNEYLISLAPDEDSCTMALHYVIEKGKTVVQAFLEVVVEIITTDDKINIREKAFLARTIDILEQAGYTFRLPA